MESGDSRGVHFGLLLERKLTSKYGALFTPQFLSLPFPSPPYTLIQLGVPRRYASGWILCPQMCAIPTIFQPRDFSNQTLNSMAVNT